MIVDLNGTLVNMDNVLMAEPCRHDFGGKFGVRDAVMIAPACDPKGQMFIDCTYNEWEDVKEDILGTADV